MKLNQREEDEDKKRCNKFIFDERKRKKKGAERRRENEAIVNPPILGQVFDDQTNELNSRALLNETNDHRPK